MTKLTRSQKKAIDHFIEHARKHKLQSQRIIQHVLRMANIPEEVFQQATRNLRANARIALHFHPERPDATKKPVAEALLEQGLYRNQFETKLSSGSLSAVPGGMRDLWENRLFGGAYQLEGTTNDQRPKYGALHILPHPDGPSPRFGSCYFLLTPDVSKRATFTYLDSHLELMERGTYEEFAMIWSALLEDAFSKESALGAQEINPNILISHILQLQKQPLHPNKNPSRNLDSYIDVHIHGHIYLEKDVEILVDGHSFKGTKIGKTLDNLCKKHAIHLHWHHGFSLKAEEVPANFRGASMPSLAKRIAPNGTVDAYAIGRAVMDLQRNPQLWSDRGSIEEVMQD